MSILVAGGAGFIGSNFVIDWLALSDESVVNLDKLTYDGPWLRLAGHRHPRSLLEASKFIATPEKRQGLKVACSVEIAYCQRWINSAQLESLAEPLLKNGYGKYLAYLLKDTI